MKRFTRKPILVLLSLLLMLSVFAALTFTASAMNINVKVYLTDDPTTYSIDVEPIDRIEDVKARVSDLTGIAPDQQVLVFAGTTLEDDKTLQDYSIQRDSTIHVNVRMPYAVFDSSAQTLTFAVGTKTDDGVVRANGDTVSGDNYYTGFTTAEYSYSSKAPWYAQRSNITRVVFLDEISPISTEYWFYDCTRFTAFEGLSMLDTSNVTKMSSMFFGCRSLTSLDVNEFNTSNVTDMSSVFSGCRGLTSLDLRGFNTSNVTDMSYMFSNCSGLTSLNMSSFNTSNVTMMSSMFSGCSGLTSLDVTGLNTSNVTNMSMMFNSCSGLTTLDLSGFNTSKVKSISNMFSGCSGLTTLDLNGFDTSSVTNMMYVFQNCSGLTSLDLCSFNTSNVTSMLYMFSGCSALTYLNVSSFNTSNVASMQSMFANCTGLTLLNIRSFNTSNVTNMEYMFNNCRALTSLDLSSFNTSKVTSMTGMFRACSSLSNLKLGANYQFKTFYGNTANLPDAPTTGTYSGKWIREGSDDAALTAAELMANYNGATMAGTYIWEIFTPYAIFNASAQTLTFAVGTQTDAGVVRADGDTISGDEYYTGFTTDTYTSGSSIPWYDQRRNITTVVFLDSISPISTAYWFYNFSNLGTLEGLNLLDTSDVTNMKYMFYYCFYYTSPVSLDLRSFDTSKVTSFANMFEGCRNLNSLDMSGLDTSSVTSMFRMFCDCSGLTSLNISGFNTSNVTVMSCMFSNCSSLTSLDVSGFNTSNVTIAMEMFHNCSGLTSLDVSGFNTSKVTNMMTMFAGCSGLTSLDLSGFNTAKVTTMLAMFSDCSSLSTLKLGENFTFKANASLPEAPTTGTYTGNWIRINSEDALTAAELMETYNGATMSGTYVWECDHVFGDPSWTWAEGYTAATATFACTNCGKELGSVTDSAPVPAEVFAATCTDDQVVKYTAKVTFNNAEYSTETEDTTVPNTAGHSFIDHDAKDPTCTAVGWNAYQTCENCDYTSYVEIPANGHAYVNHDAKAPTCTEIGWNAYQTCENCDYTSYVEIPANGHAYVNHDAQTPTCTEIGWNAYRTCENCDYTEYVEIPANGHAYVNHEAQAPTCTEVGWEAYRTCENCDYTEYVELPANGGHVYGTIGVACYTCKVCGTVDAARKAAFDRAAADKVIALIEDIGTVKDTDSCHQKILAARDAYDKLTDAQKALVTNYAKLQQAEARYYELTELPCKWCGEIHDSSLGGGFIAIWHSILYFFAHLFGKK